VAYTQLAATLLALLSSQLYQTSASRQQRNAVVDLLMTQYSNAAPCLVARLLSEMWTARSSATPARAACAETAGLLLLVLINQEWRASVNPYRSVLRRLQELQPGATQRQLCRSRGRAPSLRLDT